MSQRENKILSADRLFLKQSVERLVQLYESISQPEKATDWNKKLSQFNELAEK